jgi:hypothetical protein
MFWPPMGTDETQIITITNFYLTRRPRLHPCVIGFISGQPSQLATDGHG